MARISSPKGQTKKPNLIQMLLPVILTLVVISIVFNFAQPSNEPLNYNEFVTLVDSKTISAIKVSPNNPVIDFKGTYKNAEGNEVEFSARIPYTQTALDTIMGKLNEQQIKNVVAENPNSQGFLSQLLFAYGPTILMIVVFIFFITKMGGGNSKALEMMNTTMKMETNRKVKFANVAGSDEEKAEMEELVHYLKEPKKYTKMGARIPKGVLLVGQPGTGKTLLARAIAGEAEVPFYFIAGSEFEEMFVGLGASRVRNMFKKAKETAPCIVFIDEIDAVGRKRSESGFGDNKTEQTLNQLLVEMDGFSTNEGVIILAATNRADVLDAALLRPGRFDRQITIPLPDRKSRIEIFKLHAKNKPLDATIDFDDLAQRTPGFSGAEIENVLNEAALLTVREDGKTITTEIIDEAIDRVIAGPAKKSRRLTDIERETVAHHEAGHTIAGLKVKDADVVQKVTIIPRGNAGGYVMSTPKDDRFLYTKRMLHSQIVGLLAGRASEEVFFDDISSGASDDIKKATNIAYTMVTQLGMSDLGTIQFEREEHQYVNYTHSDLTKDRIDAAVKEIIDNAYVESKQIIIENKETVALIAKVLLEKETLVKEEILYLVEHGHLKDAKPDTEQEVVDVTNNN